MSQSLAENVQQQVSEAIVDALKQLLGFSWVRSQTLVNPYVVRLA